MKQNIDIELLVQQITDEVIAILGNSQPSFNNHSFHAHDVETLHNLGVARIGATLGVKNIASHLAPIIDHTLLKAHAIPSQIESLCQEAMHYGFASVCINPCYVKYAARILQGSRVKVCTVIGFPLGATTTATKVYEAQLAEDEGAQELDMVIPIGALKSQGYDYVENDIASIVRNTRSLVKVIIETCYLTEEEKIKACQIAKKAGAHYVKTSTGFGSGGAKVEDIILMRRTVGSDMGVKASGGIRDRQTAESMVNAGASRLGVSASIKIVTE